MRPDEARQLSAVHAGSPVGDLLRRYWMPVAAESELDERPVCPVKLLGEDFVLYRDGSATLGLIDRWCPHRRSDLAYGCVETRGLRCFYHGWRFSESGECLEQPYEERVGPSFRERVQIASFPVRAKAGLIWAYLGPEPSPLIPDWAGFYSPGFTIAALMHVPCNWIQIMEGLYDPVHVEWLHDRWSYRLHGNAVPERRPRHTDFRWLDFEYGEVFQRKLEGSDQWLADRTTVFPNIDGAGGQGWLMTWVVPEDEFNSLLVYRLAITSWKSPLGLVMVPPRRGEPQERIPAYRTRPRLDPDVVPGEDVKSYLVSQDVVAWAGAGSLVDRTRERLGKSDAGVIMFRRKLMEQARIAAAGGDPQGVIRDPDKNRTITLPGARRSYGVRAEGLPGMLGEEDVVYRAFLPAGVPEELKREIETAMAELVKGLRPDWWRRKDRA